MSNYQLLNSLSLVYFQFNRLKKIFFVKIPAIRGECGRHLQKQQVKIDTHAWLGRGNIARLVQSSLPINWALCLPRGDSKESAHRRVCGFLGKWTLRSQLPPGKMMVSRAAIMNATWHKSQGSCTTSPSLLTSMRRGNCTGNVLCIPCIHRKLNFLPTCIEV